MAIIGVPAADAIGAEQLQVYSVSAIASSHSNEQTRRYFATLLSDFARLQAAASTQATFLYTPSREINAFATVQNGKHYVVVHHGLLAYFGRDRTAIDAVLAHELGHVRNNHVTQGAQVDALLQLITTVAGLAIDINQARKVNDGLVGLGSAAGSVGAALLSRSYTRDQEREADRESVNLLIESGIHPDAAIRAQELLQKLSGGNPPLLFATHPPTDERVANLRQQVAESSSQIQAKVATRFQISDQRVASERERLAESAKKKAELEAERAALNAKSTAAIVERANAANSLEQRVLGGASPSSAAPARDASAPQGEECKDRGANRRTCISKDSSGKSVVRSCERTGSLWSCAVVGGN